ncbi:MAG: GatB/YqeY domain-containing protein [Bacilli bacterium]|nr:GatB/YqeY domain-containing protein [Bacilli bacterium]
MYDQIRKDLTEAMKSGDKFKLGVIRMLKAALMNEEVKLHGNGNGLTDDEVIAVVKREVKTRNTSIEEYTNLNKMEVVDELKKEIEVLSVYLPPEMSDEELEKIVSEIIDEVHPESIKDMGRIMKEITAKYGSAIDMSKASKIVKEKLS